MNKTLLLLLLPVSIFTGCVTKYKCPTTVYCTVGMNFVFTGYGMAGLDTVIMRVYKGDGSFSVLVDTGIIENKWDMLRGHTDSLLNASMSLVDRRIFAADSLYVPYDWELYIPKQGRTYRVSRLTFVGDEKQTVEGCDHEGRQLYTGCAKTLSTYLVDGKEEKNYTGNYSKYRDGFVILRK